MKNVLIVSYYWPPAGGGGVMRWFKMSKYLANDSEWNPIIFTAKTNHLTTDESLLSEVPETIQVYREPIIEPNNFLDLIGLRKIKQQTAAGGIGKSNQKSSLLQSFIFWIRANIFIPDARALWIKPASKKIISILKEQKIDAIITTGPPHSMHLIGLRVKKKTGIAWIADFRDPWTFIDFFDDLNLSNSAKAKHKKLEKEVIENADELVTVSNSWGKDFEKLYAKKFNIIHNGYDPADFKIDENRLKVNTKFVITHIGSLNKDRNLPVFWNAIKALCDSNSDFKEKLEINLIGNVTKDLATVIDAHGLSSVVNIVKHKSHSEVIEQLYSSSLLLLLINNTPNLGGIIPGKIYEYMATQRPILCIGYKQGDSAQIIENTKSGVVIGYEEQELLEKAIMEYYNRFKVGNQLENVDSINIERYSRKKEALDYAILLDNMIKKGEND